MVIRDLSQTSNAEIVEALLDAFSTYEIKMPDDVNYWTWRFRNARLRKDCSYGMFDADRLVGFILIGIDDVDGKKVAFNTGTGVVGSHRSQHIVDQLYAQASEKFKSEGVNENRLEVLVNNKRAIRVYERIGFQIERTLRCFKIAVDKLEDKSTIVEISVSGLLELSMPRPILESWDHMHNAIRQDIYSYKGAQVLDQNNVPIGHIIYHPKYKSISQIVSYVKTQENLNYLVSQFCGFLENGHWKINNIDASRVELCNALVKHNADNFIDQYEMKMT